jgi:hypothetical protein
VAAIPRCGHANGARAPDEPHFALFEDPEQPQRGITVVSPISSSSTVPPRTPACSNTPL